MARMTATEAARNFSDVLNRVAAGEEVDYIPAPGKRSAMYRDWVVMFICRRFFKRVILHWHAAGLAKWLETSVQIRSRALTYRVMKQVDAQSRHEAVSLIRDSD